MPDVLRCRCGCGGCLQAAATSGALGVPARLDERCSWAASSVRWAAWSWAATTADAFGTQRHQGDHIAAAYIDPLWNLVLANSSFRAILPGTEDYHDNLSSWFFHPGASTSTAEHLVIDRDNVAAYLVATLRGGLGRHRDTAHARAHFQDLRGAPLFCEHWDTSSEIAYGRRFNDPIHLKNPTTSEPYSEHVHLGEVPGAPEVRFCLCYPKPYSGPPLP